MRGLYTSTDTNSENPTYYFRENVENNYVSFAEQTWRIVRINEDGTIRIISQIGFESSFNNNYMYYINSNVENGAMQKLNDWYTTNIEEKGYSSFLVSGNYYCEQAKIKYADDYTSGNVQMVVYSSYSPSFKCEDDDNGYGLVNTNIGLITCDEVIFAGGYFSKSSNYYLNNGTNFWTMSPAGVTNTYSTM